LNLSLIVNFHVPPACRQDVSAFAGSHNLKANTIGDATVENESQRVENYRLSRRYPEQLQLLEHLCDLVYKWADLLGKRS
jgi:hypothetical protein